jgi:D-sedoheptulose 7-phosphate isomerase
MASDALDVTAVHDRKGISDISNRAREGNSMESVARRYYQDLMAGLAAGPPAELAMVAQRLVAATRSGQRVFAFGNGASAALAAHMACDLGKGSASDLGADPSAAPATARLRIVSLPDNVALTTAYGNDVDFSSIFVEPLKNLLEPGDVLIGISASGRSPNVVKALQYGRSRQATTIALTGLMHPEPEVVSHADIVVRAPSAVIEQIEDFHVAFHHIIGLMLRRELGTAPGEWSAPGPALAG